MENAQEIRDTRRRGRNRSSGLREWIKLLDGILAAIEEVVWDVRNAGSRTFTSTRRIPKQVGRLAATGWCLTKIASSYRLHVTRAAFLSEKRAAVKLEALHQKNAKRFYELSAEHGGAFLKVGQLLSARADLLPDAWVKELSKLQDQAPPVPFDEVRATIEEDFGAELDVLFTSFEETPIAAASIGQVHRAIDKAGHTVAVKVRRPNIENLIEHDLDLLEAFVEGVRSSLPPTDWETVTREVRAMITAEVDYPREVAIMGQLGAFLERVDGVVTPTADRELSSDRVIVSTFEAGRRITDVLDELRANDERDRIATILGRLLEAYVSQVLEAGVFQADPHPGNFLVREDDTVVMLDFGCAKEIPTEVRDLYLQLVQAAMVADRERIAVVLDALGFATESGSHDTLLVFADLLLRDFRDAALSGSFAWPSQEDILRQMRASLDAAEDDPVIRVPDHFVMLARVFGTLAGLFLHYRPTIDYATHVLPSFSRAVA